MAHHAPTQNVGLPPTDSEQARYENYRDMRRTHFLIVLQLFCTCPFAAAQTPSPLQEWQYSGGVILARLFEPDLPKFRTILGVAADVQPVYSGADAYRVQGGPVINIQYRDVAFVATGDGIGYNFLRGDHFQVGAAVVYDLGRKMNDDLSNLKGMGDISAAAGAKVFASWVISRKFPLIMRVDARQFVGGVDSAVGDAAVYLPLPGSSKTFVMFAGPSITLATRHYMQNLYGVTPAQSLASGHPVYEYQEGAPAPRASDSAPLSSSRIIGSSIWMPRSAKSGAVPPAVRL
jgi:outer membrane scaffolding protein for murein synthesis (MipA/OmpV family)